MVAPWNLEIRLGFTGLFVWRPDLMSKQLEPADLRDHATPGNGTHSPWPGADSAGPSDPFDPSRLRLSQNFTATVGVKKRLTTVPVRKPSKQDFIRVHRDSTYRLETAVLELKDEGETYLVDPNLWPELAGELIPKVLYLASNRQKVVFLWPIRLPDDEGKLDDWNRSALEAAEIAQGRWTRVVANRSLGAYEVFEATGDLPDPEWPELTFAEILKIAFKDRFIEDLNHPALRRLRGEV
jgi:hypothetical protein